MEKIRMENLSFQYPLGEVQALKNINMSVEQSQFVVVCGKSGCGKSTLLRHMKKSLMPYGTLEGTISFEGKNLNQLDERTDAEEIGFVRQNPDNQLVTDKVWHELAFGLENLGMSNSVIKRRVAEMASYFGIQNWFRKDVSELSGGQKQLLNLASVMAMQPSLLVLDEPASQLDPIAASDFLNTIYKINRDLGVTVIISEHRLEDVFPMADKVVVMDKGEIIFTGSPREAGHVLYDYKGNGPHPMYYGLPSVMRIFPQDKLADAGIKKLPLTVREGRLTAESILGETEEDMDGKSHQLKKIREEEIPKDKIAIRANNLWFRYSKEGQDILRGMSLNVEEGTLHCLLGGNGSGKSTTLKAFMGIIKCQKGKLTLKDGQKIAMVPQNPQAIFTEISVEDELMEGMAYMKISDDQKIKNVEKMLDLMEISHLRKSNPYDLSGGEQQRLAIGKVMLMEPDILLLDEPTKGLDPFFKMTMGGILQKLRSSGTTVFMVSHDIEFCAMYGDRCSMFFDGEITASGGGKAFFSGNNFYTTTANKILKKWKADLITCEEAYQWLEKEQ